MRLTKKKGLSENTKHLQRSSLLPYIRNDFASVLDTDTAKTAIDRIRQSVSRDSIFYIYVVDRDFKLHGVLSIRDLLLANEHDLVEKICHPKPAALQISMQPEEAYAVFTKNRFLSLPVVDHTGKMHGIVHAHELAGLTERTPRDLMVSRGRTELFELLGIKAEDFRKSPLRAAGLRLPWLMINICGGLLCAFLIEKLGHRIPRAVEFLAFIPILLIISESVGMQAASIAIGTLNSLGMGKRAFRRISREWLVAFFIGTTCSTLVGGAVWVLRRDSVLAIAITATIFLSCMGVTLIAQLTPYLFHRWQLDPRVAAGPVVLSISDCLTLLLFLTIVVGLS